MASATKTLAHSQVKSASGKHVQRPSFKYSSQRPEKKPIDIEFKRYCPKACALQTYLARVPSHQENIVQFFKLVKPLAEGGVFTMYTRATRQKEERRVKLEVRPRHLDKIRILEATANQELIRQIPVHDLEGLHIEEETIKVIAKFKENRDGRYVFKCRL